MFKFLISTVLGMSCTALCLASGHDELRFDPTDFRVDSITMPMGDVVKYKAYEGIFYVTDVQDSTYQSLNIYVPDKLSDKGPVPVFVRTYVGGYAASKAKSPSATDATGRALQEGYVLCIPGSRGNNSIVTRNGKTIVTGTAPDGLLDLKAAIRYLRYNDDLIPGDSELIFTDGTSAGGAMSALLGATGDAPQYDSLLKQMGAADASDKVFASICYCPITDLNHADMEYEWLYGCTNRGIRHLDTAQIEISDALAAECPAYIESLDMRLDNGEPLTASNYRDYLKKFLIASAHKALEEGYEIPDTIGIIRYKPGMDRHFPDPQGGGGRLSPSFGPGNAPKFNFSTDFVVDVDLDRYLSYVAAMTPLKTPPAFDQWGVLIDVPSPENKVFGDSEGNPANFTDFSLRHRMNDNSVRLTADMVLRVELMNPMNFIESNIENVAQHWFIRHGAKDRDTSFLVPVNLATKLRNSGKNVDFALPWNRPHSGDYNLDDLFGWISRTLSGYGSGCKSL